MIGQRLGPYEITAKLGEGGMGEVWRARDTKLRRDVAIKVLPAAFVEERERLARFEREAQLLAQLNHPNIAQIYGMEAIGDAHALIIELVEGPTLAELLESGALPLDESLSLARHVAEALEEAHEKGIIHRDLKPQNIKASREGKVKVLDFGLAKAMDPTGAASGAASASQLAASPTLTLGATVQGVILGTAAYMSPEQAKGLAVDKRADIWAFGVVLYEMLTGRRLFSGDSVPEVLASVINGAIDLDALSEETPPAIHRLLRRCLQRRPKERLRDIGDARIVIEEALGPGGTIELATESQAPAASHRLPWTIAAASALVAAGSLLMPFLGRGAAPRSEPASPTRATILSPGPDADLPPGNFALAPDGGALVYVEEGQTTEEVNQQVLYVRELDEMKARPLEGTKGAKFPFWSADSRFIGFFAGGELRRVPRGGGAVQRICAAKAGRGGAWNAEGTIVFADGVFGPLFRVRASGGEPVAATVLDDDLAIQQSHRFPVFLPDSRHFLFLAGTDARTVARVGSLDAPTAGRPLLESMATPRFAPPDWLVFESSGALVAQKIDLDRLEMLGEPQLLVDRPALEGWEGAARADLSNNGRMVYATRDLRPSRLTWIDRVGRRTEAGRVEGRAENIAISHRGDRIVAWSRFPDAHRVLWLVEPGSRGATRLTAPELTPNSALWSTNDQSIFTMVGRFGISFGSQGLSVLPVNGGAPRSLLPSSNRWMLPLDTSADGRILLLNELVSLRGYDIVWMQLDASADSSSEPSTYLATLADESPARLSPDGRWTAYVSNASGRREVYLDRFPKPGDAQRIAASEGASDVYFRSDGRELFVAAADEGGSALFAYDLRLDERAKIGPRRKLFDLPAGAYAFAAAPSGDRFLVAEPEGNFWSSLTLVDHWAAQLATAR
jgi:hypothetical protein